MKVASDQSLFAWGIPQDICIIEDLREAERAQVLEVDDCLLGSRLLELLAESPADFANSGNIFSHELFYNFSPIVINCGVRIELSFLIDFGFPREENILSLAFCSDVLSFALLACYYGNVNSQLNIDNAS